MAMEMEKNHRVGGVMRHLYEAFDYIANILPVTYFIALVIAVYQYRRVNSTVICIALLLAMESSMNIINEPLLSLNSREVWYGTWIALDGLMVFLLYRTHSVLKINLAKITNTVAWAYVVLAFVQTARYMDRSFLDGALLNDWYYLIINTINISVALLVVLSLFKEEKPVGIYI